MNKHMYMTPTYRKKDWNRGYKQILQCFVFM